MEANVNHVLRATQPEMGGPELERHVREITHRIFWSRGTAYADNTVMATRRKLEGCVRYEKMGNWAANWALIEQADGSIPMPLVGLLVAWPVLIFGSFGYRAPRNPVVVTSFFLASALIAGALYLILDMDSPFAGPIQISAAPLHRVIAEMQR
jgi:hypothetical protein